MDEEHTGVVPRNDVLGLVDPGRVTQNFVGFMDENFGRVHLGGTNNGNTSLPPLQRIALSGTLTTVKGQARGRIKKFKPHREPCDLSGGLLDAMISIRRLPVRVRRLRRKR